MNTDYQLLFTTCPDEESAQELANILVEERLAACVNILSGVSSVYRWQGEIKEAEEYILIIKSTASIYPKLALRMSELHPYDVPELIALPINQGLPSYLAWLEENVGKTI